MIFLKVDKTSPLNKLNRVLRARLKKYGQLKLRNFVPHLTLGHGDLTKENFDRAKRDLKNLEFRRKFTVKNLKLFILREGSNKWRLFKNYSFK